MRLQRKLTNKEWAEIGEKYKDGGAHMFRGKKTYFYNGKEKLWDPAYYTTWLIYNEEERGSWEVIIILPGVEWIPEQTCLGCIKVTTVIMADTVKRVEEIDRHAFTGCTKLIIFSVSQNTQIGRDVFRGCTELLKACPFCEEDHYYNSEYVNEWIKNINVRPNDKYLLLRECSSFKPRAENICAIVKSVGIQAFREKNLIGVTPAQYLEANNFTQIDQTKIINRYILDLMGETV